MHALKRMGFLVAVLAGGLAACSSTVSDAGLTTSTNGGGACTAGCSGGDVCQNNQCVSPCVAAGGTLCGAICVNTQTDNANCGACAMACSQGKVCSAGNCAATCTPGYDVCTTDAGFYCAVLAGDSNNCGSCGKVCGSGKYCSASNCMSSQGCPQGLTLCEPDGGTGTCVSLQGDNNNCGQCGKACGAGESCLAATCQSGPTCPNGLLACPNATGGSTCVAYLIDPANCGGCSKSCGGNGICTEGACSCPGLYSQCGTTAAPSCAALQFDTANCGSCGNACSACQTCGLGVCTAESFLTASAVGIPAEDGGGYGAIAIGDFNGDGANDIATSSGTDVLVFFGWDGGFGSPTTLSLGTGQISTVVLTTGDFNGDGVTDLVAAYAVTITTPAYTYSTKASVFIGSATGFTTLGPFGISAMGYSVYAAVTGDFNADTYADIAVGDNTGVTVLYGDGSGGFSEVGGLPGGIPGYVNYAGLASGDINGDGVSDLALVYTMYTGGGGVTILDALFGSDAGIDPANSSSVTANSLNGALAIGSGAIDAFGQSVLMTYVYDPDAGLIATGSSTASNVGTAIAMDLNGDGLMDLVAQGYTSVSVWLRNDGGFGLPFSVSAPAGGIAVGDLNGDGRPDVAVTNGLYSPSGGTILLNTCQ